MAVRVKKEDKKLPCGAVVIRPYGYELRFGICAKEDVYKSFRNRLRLSKLLEHWFFYDGWKVNNFEEWVKKFPKQDDKIKRIINKYRKKALDDSDDFEDYRDNICLEVKEVFEDVITHKSHILGEHTNLFMENFLEIVPDYFKLKKEQEDAKK